MISHFGTAHHVERLVRNYRSVKRNEALAKAQDQHAHRQLSWFVDDDGYWVIRGRLPPDTGALVTQVLQQAMDDQFDEVRERRRTAGHEPPQLHPDHPEIRPKLLDWGKNG